LKEAIERTKPYRKYLIIKLKAKSNIDNKRGNRKRRKACYGSYVKVTLVKR